MCVCKCACVHVCPAGDAGAWRQLYPQPEVDRGWWLQHRQVGLGGEVQQEELQPAFVCAQKQCKEKQTLLPHIRKSLIIVSRSFFFRPGVQWHVKL